MIRHCIKLKVAAVSSSANSFGLRGHVLMSRTGIVLEIGLNHLNGRKRGDVVEIPVTKRDVRDMTAFIGAVIRTTSCEIPMHITPNAPPEVVQEVWAQKNNSNG